MKIVIALDSFKHCFTAAEGCGIAAEAIREVAPDAEIIVLPMADGGEGTARAMIQALDGEWVPHVVTGPFMDMQVEAGFAWFPESYTALVEMASASGIQLIRPERRNPLMTTTFGTGELLCAARDQGAKKIYLAVGGSATVELGIGMAAALGWRFTDRAGRTISPIGENLIHVHSITDPDMNWNIPVEVLCDVTNPLLGDNGAASVFGPQKGANESQVVILELGLAHFSAVIKQILHKNIENLAGGGAAGGLSAGAAAFLGARLVSGVETILKTYQFEVKIYQADWVITGEGRLDYQSLSGKVVSGILNACADHPAKVVVFAGSVSLPPELWKNRGIFSAVSITPEDMEIETALSQGRVLLRRAVRNWAESQLGNIR